MNYFNPHVDLRSNNESNKTGDTFITQVLGKLLPRRMKRLIFVSSFIAHLSNTTNPDKTLLTKINNLLSLSNRDEALLLPIQLQKQIWDKVLIERVLKERSIVTDDLSQISNYNFRRPQLRMLSEDIVRLIPKWLVYNSNSQMKHDIMCIFENMENLTQKACKG